MLIYGTHIATFVPYNDFLYQLLVETIHDCLIRFWEYRLSWWLFIAGRVKKTKDLVATAGQKLCIEVYMKSDLLSFQNISAT